jgi:hypothetical protein
VDTKTGLLFDSLREEVIELHVRWKLYRLLYAGAKEDVILLKSSGSSVFGLLQSLLFDDCLLRVCRLTDPATAGRYTYRSVRRLVNVLLDHGASVFECDLDADLKELESACSEIRTLRNTRIAHADLEHSLEIAESPLPGVSIEDVNRILGQLSRLLNHVEIPLRRSRTFYGDALVPIDVDAERLFSLLRQAHGQHPGA